jgi:hypothetical protein
MATSTGIATRRELPVANKNEIPLRHGVKEETRFQQFLHRRLDNSNLAGVIVFMT